jgi:hypothetical protein
LASKSNYTKSRVPSLAVQLFSLNQAYSSTKGNLSRGTLYWKVSLQPTPLSANYDVEITYRLHGSPSVWVSGENLLKLDAPGFPHKYSVDKEKCRVNICLYLPGEFDKAYLLADTIVPWTIEWLYFYEMWLATGDWLGGGKHPDVLC